MMEDKQYGGMIRDLPVVTGGHFIKDSEKRIVFGPDRFWNDYVMRCFTLNPGAASDSHAHPWSHWTICIEGDGFFNVGDETYELHPGAYVHVPANLPHNFGANVDGGKLSLICIVPPEGDVNPLTMGFC